MGSWVSGLIWIAWRQHRTGVDDPGDEIMNSKDAIKAQIIKPAKKAR